MSNSQIKFSLWSPFSYEKYLFVWELREVRSFFLRYPELLQQCFLNCKPNLKSCIVLKLLALNRSVVLICICRANPHRIKNYSMPNPLVINCMYSML